MILSAVDSNILIYALADQRDAIKTGTAVRLIDRLAASESCAVSTQVLKEFANFCTKKLKPPMASAVLLDYLDDLSSFRVVIVDTEIIKKAVVRHRTSQISFYDALIVEAAIAGGRRNPLLRGYAAWNALWLSASDQSVLRIRRSGKVNFFCIGQ